MEFRPLHDRLLVERLEREETTRGGIVIPDTAKEKQIEGKVLAVGNGRVLDDGTVRTVDLRVGDRTRRVPTETTDAGLGRTSVSCRLQMARPGVADGRVPRLL